MTPASRTTLFALLVSVPSLSAAQSDSTTLPTVVVTATRVDSPLGAGIPSVTVLDADALLRRGVHTVIDALRTVPGAALVRSGGPGAQTSIFVRGGESDYLRVLVDGVPMNDPGGAIDLASYTLDNVDRIEVVRGPASVLYGTDAVTGVVQIFTRRASSPLSIEATIGASSYRGRDASASLNTRSGPLSLTTALSRRTSDGILPFNNGYRNTVWSARAGYDAPSGARITLSGRAFDDAFHYPTDGAGAVVDQNAFRTDRRTAIALDGAQPLGRHLRAEFTLSALDGSGRTDDAADGPGDTLGFYAYRSAGTIRRRTADVRLQLFGSTHGIATMGGEWSTESQRSRDSSNFGPTAKLFDATRSTRAGYAQWVGQEGRLQYTVGGRYDDNTVFGAFRTARAGASVALWRGAHLRASYGNAFKAPTFLEQFNTAFSVGNHSLAPERSRSGELGFSQSSRGGRVIASATWFDQRFKDMIQYTYVDPASPNYFNVAEASARGVEFELRVRAASTVQLIGNSTLLRTRVEDAGFDSGAGATFVAGERLLRRPAHTASLSAVAQPLRRASFNLTVLRIGDRDDRDFRTFPARPVVLPAYTRIDAGTEFRLVDGASMAPAFALVLRAENLFGTEYAEVANFPAPGRVLSIGVRAMHARPATVRSSAAGTTSRRPDRSAP